MNTDRFNPQFEMMISLSIQHLKYPEWFDITKKTTENEDEETFLELREDLIRFLEPLIQRNRFKDFITLIIDDLLQKIYQSGVLNGEIRDLDVILTLIGIFLAKSADTDFLLKKYSLFLFSPRLQVADCLIFSDIVLEIY